MLFNNNHGNLLEYKQVLQKFISKLERNSIVIFDHWNNEDVRTCVFDTLEKECQRPVLYSFSLLSDKNESKILNASVNEWWNGYGVLIV